MRITSPEGLLLIRTKLGQASILCVLCFRILVAEHRSREWQSCDLGLRRKNDSLVAVGARLVCHF